MLLHTLSQYIEALENRDIYLRTLSGLNLCYRDSERPYYSVGNSAVLFKVEIGGEYYSLKCFFKTPSTDLVEIYGEAFKREEIFICDDSGGGEWVDVVLLRWVEGETLDVLLRKLSQLGDSSSLLRLSKSFDYLAAELLVDDWAHGDLKPENIIVDAECGLNLVDFDSAFIPKFEGRVAPELGTPSFCHPSRSAEDFDRWLDHYSVALIAVQLRALALEPKLLFECGSTDGLIFGAEEIFGFNSLDEESYIYGRGLELKSLFERVESLFMLNCEPLHYQLMRELYSAPLRSMRIEHLLSQLLIELTDNRSSEVFIDCGLCGFRSDEGVVIRALFDEAFEFVEGCAVVRLGEVWHVIDSSGRSLWRARGIAAAKLLRGGVVRWLEGNTWHELKIKK